MSEKITKSQLVLIVEDNEDDYEATLRALKNVQLQNPLYRCKTGHEALDFLKRQGNYKDVNVAMFDRPGLILLDLNMPGIDGRKTLQLIKEDESLRGIPVVILTTSGSEYDITSCYQTGANTYIQKPVSFDGLMDAMRQLKDYWFKIARLPANGLSIGSL
jgi:two-component system, response regulator